jgi:hypothetical protein
LGESAKRLHFSSSQTCASAVGEAIFVIRFGFGRKSRTEPSSQFGRFRLRGRPTVWMRWRRKAARVSRRMKPFVVDKMGERPLIRC